MEKAYTIGLDYGTNSVRALVVDARDGTEIATSVWEYRRGDAGIVLDPSSPEFARQHPADYLDGLQSAVRGALDLARSNAKFAADRVIGIGIDTTGSTPIPVDSTGTPLAMDDQFADNPNALAWLWKDHTSYDEAQKITELAERIRPNYLAKVGGTYSSEWFWAKIWHCMNVDRKVFDAAASWIECADWIPAVITGNQQNPKRGVCAAGHKALYHSDWGGYPEPDFLEKLDPDLNRIRSSLPVQTFTVADSAGELSPEWAETLGLNQGIPVAVGAFDAHLGGIGSGIDSGVLVKNVGTSTCDMMVEPISSELADIPGLCGIVPGSILPGFYGMEAGQSAVGDIFNWFVQEIEPGGKRSHDDLVAGAEKLAPGQSGLLSLDWHSGNRTVLVDQRLSGMILGLNLHSTAPEIYRALIEATAFGARVIVERFEEFGVSVKRVVNCGGIAAKNKLVMQIYADVMNRTMEISKSDQTAALGSAIAGCVVAGAKAGGYDDFASATRAMTGVREDRFEPERGRVAIYDELFAIYRRLHDSFGTNTFSVNHYSVMKDLLAIRDKSRQ